MFAVSVIIKRPVLVLVACFFLLQTAGWEKCDARTRIDPGGFSASGFNRVTERQGPSLGHTDENDSDGVTDVDVVGIIKANQDGKSLMLPGSVFQAMS